MNLKNTAPNGDLDEGHPPILGNWNNFYALVIVLHAVIIGLFYWFTHLFS